MLCEAARRSGNENRRLPLPLFQESLCPIHPQRVGTTDHSKYLSDTLPHTSASRDFTGTAAPLLYYCNVLHDVCFHSAECSFYSLYNDYVFLH